MAEPSHPQHRPQVGQDPATAAQPPTELGYLYPENDILAVVDDQATGERALAALRQNGVSLDDMDLLAGDWFVERMTELRDRHRLKQLVGFSDERDILQGYVDEAEKGHCLVMVHAAEPRLIESVRQVLVSIGAHDLHHWERFTITSLSEQGPAAESSGAEREPE
jgi:hypothetical protein